MELIKKFGLEKAKNSNVLINTTCKLDRDEDGTSVDQRLYRNMIGSHLYLTVNRPNTMLSVYLCARFQENPMESPIKAVNKVIKCVKLTANFGLWFSKQ